MREYYDLWDRFSHNLPWRARVKQHVRRRLIHAGDHYLLTRNVTRVFAQSKTIQKRLIRWGGIPSEVIYPPAPKRSYRCDDYEDYLFVVSRLTPLKRIELIIDALAHPDAVGVKCLIGGDGEDRERLQSLIEARGLGNRVTLLGQLDESTLINHYARCRAVCYPPLQEDYGFVTVEAFSASKPIITCTDSGGPTELVQSGVSGLISEPTSGALASAIGTLMADRSLAQKYGAAGRHFADSLSWDQTLRKLLIV
jgi:glycosyltransferase involved in cell wall biosynthesis